jgi:putative ABC transport system permease protein
MESLLQDLRYALRLLRKSPGFAIASVLTLALGMGANTVMFSVLNTVLLRPLPYPHPDRLVQIWETDSRRDDMLGSVVSPYNFVDWRAQSQTFEQMSTYDFNSMVLTGQKTPARLSTIFVSSGFFEVFKVPPLKGRTFLSDEDQPGKPRVAVLGYTSWLRNFGGDPEIVGKSISLDDQAYSVIGVMPAGFAFPHDGVDAWCLPGFDLKQTTRASHFLFAVGRLRPGVDLKQAQTEMDTIAGHIIKTNALPAGSGVRLNSLHEQIVGNARLRLLVLWAAVVAVLLIACANVAGLLLARAVVRQKEVAVRSALGGSRNRIVQQFLTESVLLALIGGSLGIALSYSAGRFVVAASNGAVPRLRDLHIDGWVLAFTAAACIITGIIFGLAPALNALRFDLNAMLKEGGAAQASDRSRLRTVFVVAEVALAMVLLVAGGLLTKTLWRLQHVDTGFQPENLLTFRFTIPRTKYLTAAERSAHYERIAARLAALPGVDSVGSTNDLPFAGSRTGSSFEIEGRAPDPAIVLHADRRVVSPDYFSAMRIRLLAGRKFTLHDDRNGALVAIVNQAFARKFFPAQDPLDHRIKIYEDWHQIVGVVADVKHENLGAPGIPEMYLCYLQTEVQPWAFFVVRSRTEPKALVSAIRAAIQEVAPSEPINRVNTMNALLDFWMSPQRFSSLLLAIFAGLALILSAIGIYGVIAYNVVQRTREIGIRIALGAERKHILRLVLLQAVRIGVSGLLLGTAAAYVATWMLSGMLFGVTPHDPLIFSAVAASIMLVVTFASYIPARRATRVDPLITLRYE